MVSGPLSPDLFCSPRPIEIRATLSVSMLYSLAKLTNEECRGKSEKERRIQSLISDYMNYVTIGNCS